MEEKYRELLDIHRSKFSDDVDAEVVLPILEREKVLDQNDVDVINQLTTNGDKVAKILDQLILKGNAAFESLCAALESTYPHLLTLMFLEKNERVNPERIALPADLEEDLISRSQISVSGEAKSQDPKSTYTRVIPSYEYDFQESPGSQDGSYSDSHHFGAKVKHIGRYKHGFNGESRHSDHYRDYDWLKSQCERAMSELQALKHQQADNTKRYEAVMKESDSYRQSYMSTLAQLQNSREEANKIRNQNQDILAENKRMEQEIKSLRKLRDEDKTEIAELRKHQRDVISNSGSNEVLNALDMYDHIKVQYDSLRETYADLVSQHSSLVSKFQNTSDDNEKLKNQLETAFKERDEATLELNGLKQQCTAAIRNWHQVLRELGDLKEKHTKITQQRDDVMKQMNQALASQLRSTKELEMVQRDRDAVLKEYSLVMSERDQVHKEIEQLQEKLGSDGKKIENILKEKKTADDSVETLKREITAALQDRDKALKERNEINDKFNELISKQSVIEKECDNYKNEYEMALHERDIARKERHEALQERDDILREKYERDQIQKEKADKMDKYSKESEHMKKQMEKLQQELKVGLREAEIAKGRRDWAMSERDKIVSERDSVRTLCDNLRRDRDRAVSDLAQAIRDYDEIKKQKQDLVKELKDIREKYEMANEKETRKSQLNSVGHNHSRDSAIDADLQEWESETIDLELAGLNADDLGFDLVGGKGDLQFPNSIIVSHVAKGSPADGKLKINDQIIRINSKDISNDIMFAFGLLRNRSGIVNMQVIRRRKVSPSRSWQTIRLNIPPGKELGIQVDNALYISRISMGSFAATEGSLTVGDKIVSVNSRSVENMSPEDLMKVLYQCSNDTIVLEVWRQMTPINSPGSSPIPSGQCSSSMSSVPDHIFSPASKNDRNMHGWESNSESGKGGAKNIKTSGSQTDSLDSPVTSRRDRKSRGSKEMENKGRHSVHILDKALETVDKIFRPRHKSTERSEEEKAMFISHRPMTIIDTREDVVNEFAFPTHKKENSSSSRGSGCKRELESELSGTGTWPKCVRMSTPSTNGTVVQTQKGPRRPTLDAVINQETETNSLSVIPPQPPDRTMSSYVAVRHTPQNSDSTITYNSHPPSPISSPLPSNKNCSYFPKSPISTKHPFDSPETFTDHHRNEHRQSYPTYNQSHQNQRPRVNNTKNPPRMPPIPSHVNPGSFHMEPRPESRSRPKATPPSRDPSISISNSLYPSSPNVEYGPRSCNTTPEPRSPPYGPPAEPSNFTDRPPGGRHYPVPNNITNSVLISPNYPTPSMPVKAKTIIVQKATTTLVPNPHHGLFPDNIIDMERLPPYNHSDISSHSPSNISSSMESRFTPTPIDNHPHYPYPSLGRSDQEVSMISHRIYSDKPNRIRIPSTPSVITADTSGSVEVVSDRSSPCSPFPDIAGKLLQATSPVMEPTLYRKRPHPGETRNIKIEKTSKLVGFQIEMGPSGGIFVSSVNENSLAAQAGLVIGDQLLEICAINMRSATYDLAARVLQQCGNNLTMLVQYNPEKYNDNNSESSVASSTNASPLNSPDSKNNIHLVNRNGISRRDSHRDSPKSPNRVHSHSSQGKYDAPRKISFKKPNPNANLGITLTGGNAMGIFVSDVQENSPAGGHNGLHCGDQILEFNGMDFNRTTAEQAFRHLHEPCSSVRIKVRYHPSLYNKVRSKKGGGDSLYVRAMFDHIPEKEGELAFHKDDLLHVEDTMYNGQQGVWYAWLVNDEGKKMKGGTIPSKDRLEDDLVLHRSLSESLSLHDSDEYKTHSRRGSGSARRSFFRRSKKHQRNNSKDSRELSSFSDVSINSDSLPVLDDLSLSTYMNVERIEYKKTRPVVLIAPLADALIQKLSSESPNKYYYCDPTVMQGSHHTMEKELKDGSIIDYWLQDDRYHCIRVKSVTDICDQNIHCILNVNPLAIERLQRLQIYPIVIFARHKSFKQLREIKDVQFLPEKLSQKSAKELFDYCQKAEQDYKHLISAMIQGGNLAEMTQQIKNVIVTVQEKPIWVPTAFVR